MPSYVDDRIVKFGVTVLTVIASTLIAAIVLVLNMN
jgi:hypothetical protein